MNLRLETVYYIAIILSIAAAAVFVILFSVRQAAGIYRIRLPGPDIDGGFSLTKAAKDKEMADRLGRLADRLLPVAVFLCGAALSAAFLFSHYDAMAKSRGATGDYRKTETLAAVKDRAAHMFPDQSKDLPDDPAGYIYVFYKYTCHDCYDTHDQVMAVLEREGVEKIRFLPSTSLIGQELVQSYDIDAVPWAVYIGMDTRPKESQILYNEFETDPDAKFVEENLMAVIDAQRADLGEPTDIEKED